MVKVANMNKTRSEEKKLKSPAELNCLLLGETNGVIQKRHPFCNTGEFFANTIEISIALMNS